MKFLIIIPFYFFCLNLYTQNDFEIHKNKKNTIIKVLNKKNGVIHVDTINNTHKITKQKLNKKIDSVINKFKLRYNELKANSISKVANKVETIKVNELEQFYTNKDTLYVYFKNSKNEKHTPLMLIIPPKIEEKNYVFSFIKRKHYYNFSYKTHRKKNDKQIEIPIIKKSKRFLKNKKKEILTFCKLKRLSFKQLESFFWKNKKKLYI